MRGFFEGQFFHALRTVEGLLDDLQVERGTGPLEPTTCPVGDLVEQAVPINATASNARAAADRGGP
ncbi:MAG: hypothetical protein R2810_05090 [Flavobacteriales bacterium]